MNFLLETYRSEIGVSASGGSNRREIVFVEQPKISWVILSCFL